MECLETRDLLELVLEFIRMLELVEEAYTHSLHNRATRCSKRRGEVAVCQIMPARLAHSY